MSYNNQEERDKIKAFISLINDACSFSLNKIFCDNMYIFFICFKDMYTCILLANLPFVMKSLLNIFFHSILLNAADDNIIGPNKVFSLFLIS